MANKLIRIDRSKWIRGDDVVTVTIEGSDYKSTQGSMLLRPADGKMCCIGQACVQLGLAPEQIKHISTVDELVRNHYVRFQFLDLENDDPEAEKSAVSDAYEINDDRETTDAEKEEALVPVFNRLGLDVEFYN